MLKVRFTAERTISNTRERKGGLSIGHPILFGVDSRCDLILLSRLDGQLAPIQAIMTLGSDNQIVFRALSNEFETALSSLGEDGKFTKVMVDESEFRFLAAPQGLGEKCVYRIYVGEEEIWDMAISLE